jgi:hypothetical protein
MRASPAHVWGDPDDEPSNFSPIGYAHARVASPYLEHLELHLGFPNPPNCYHSMQT